jgi:hypothetical protein
MAIHLLNTDLGGPEGRVVKNAAVTDSGTPKRRKETS